jgi:outer membrane receptor protein involved in Fe transport
MRTHALFVCAILCSGVSSVARAQTAEPALRGIVVDARTGEALSDVAMRISRSSAISLTDGAGRFTITARDDMPVIVARLGYRTDTVSIRVGEFARIALEPAALRIEPVIVATDRPFAAATSRISGEVDLHIRPRQSSQELLGVAPGVVIAQHAGGGKAEQIFVRGFDADHGTDVALQVDGTPVNMVSHAHGQGYSDLHFLIPEIVKRVTVRKGPYAAEDGDFATGASLSFETPDRLERRFLPRFPSAVMRVHRAVTWRWPDSAHAARSSCPRIIAAASCSSRLRRHWAMLV